jgi:hypothetical protein
VRFGFAYIFKSGLNWVGFAENIYIDEREEYQMSKRDVPKKFLPGGLFCLIFRNCSGRLVIIVQNYLNIG